MKTKALLGFSIGQDYSKGEALKSDIELAVNRYDEITILCADTLQRKTKILLHKLPEAEAYTLAKADGDEWLKELTPHLAKLDDLKYPYTVVRWDNILNTDDYVKSRKLIDEQFEKSKLFNRAVKRSAGKFLARHQDKIVFNPEEKQAVIDACVDYVLEECAVISILADHTHLQYHHKLNEAVAFICKRLNIDEVVAVNEGRKIPASSSISTFFKPASVSDSPPHRDIERLVIEIHLGTIFTQIEMIDKRNDLKPEAKRSAYKQIDRFLKGKMALSDRNVKQSFISADERRFSA